jgi:hypothetical protein
MVARGRWLGCKDKDGSPQLKNALLYGSFYDNGSFDEKLFAMRLHGDGTFTWYDAHNTLSGMWKQEGSRAEFEFSTALKNRWVGTVEGNGLTNLIGPTPENFRFAWINFAKNRAPQKLKDTQWREVGRSGQLSVGSGESDGKYRFYHAYYRGLGSDGMIYEQVDQQVLLPSRTLNNTIYSGLIILNDEKLILHRYDPSPANGELKYDTYTFELK